jgi:plasmid stabilization system protein ParE
MGNHKLTEDAKEDLRCIYRYGVKEFGEAQADFYYDTLFKHLATAQKPPPPCVRFFGLFSQLRLSPPPQRGNFGGHGGRVEIEVLQKCRK